MARYKVAHEFNHSKEKWLGRLENGAWGWVVYEKAFKFANYFKAKEAFATLPVERKMYGFPMKPNFMKVEYTEEEKNLPGNEWMKKL